MEHLKPVNSANSSVLLIGRRKEEEKYVLLMISSRIKTPNLAIVIISSPLRPWFLLLENRNGGVAYYDFASCMGSC